jgi:hypothetical protein
MSLVGSDRPRSWAVADDALRPADARLCVPSLAAAERQIRFWIDALKRASAESVTVVMPYFRYAKGDKKDEPRVSIRARVCAGAIEVAGADRVVTLDLHAPQIQGFFRIPVDDLYALPILCEEITRAAGARGCLPR